MNLSLSQIEEITLGAVRVGKDENGMRFYRFTAQQEELYKVRNDDFYNKTFSTTGIKFLFSTNSQKLFLNANVIASSSSRTYFAFDVFVNGKKIDTLDNFSNVTLPKEYPTLRVPFGEFSKTFDLGSGDKEVCVYFPWSVIAAIKEFAVDDGAYVLPRKPSKKLLCFGDSITHGYDALYPCNKYITKLAESLDAEEFNKAIGGEIFFPSLASAKENFEPDYITVAYGTNDWGRCTKEVFTYNCKEFLKNLSNSYPNAKIFVITPIWRKDLAENKAFGDFKDTAEIIKTQAAAHKNVSVIYGFDFVPKDQNFFADFRLHPNDDGFDCYFKNLSKQIKEIL